MLDETRLQPFPQRERSELEILVKYSQGFPAGAGFPPKTQAAEMACAWIFNLINQLELLLRRQQGLERECLSKV